MIRFQIYNETSTSTKTDRMFSVLYHVISNSGIPFPLIPRNRSERFISWEDSDYQPHIFFHLILQLSIYRHENIMRLSAFAEWVSVGSELTESFSWVAISSWRKFSLFRIVGLFWYKIRYNSVKCTFILIYLLFRALTPLRCWLRCEIIRSWYIIISFCYA